MGVELQWDLRDFRKGRKEVEARARQLAMVFRALRRPLIADLNAHAERESSPEGKWPKRSASTERELGRRRSVFVSTTRTRKTKRRKAQVTKAAVRFNTILGGLPSTTVVRAKNFQVEAKNPVPWAHVHQFGGRVGKGAIVPERPFVFISDQVAEAASNAIADYVADGWKGKPRRVRIPAARLL